MVSTRLRPITGPAGACPTDTRARVDPSKLLNLIERIKTASGSRQTGAASRTEPAAKAG